MSENGSKDKTSELYETLPFMESFPFEEYEITLEAEGKDTAELGISQILLNVLGTFGKEERLVFSYLEKDSAVQISFYLDDVGKAADSSSKVKKLNSVKDELDEAIASTSLDLKIEAIKKSKKFIKLLDSENLLYAPFTEVLQDMLDLYQVTLTSSQILGVQRLQIKKLDEDRLILRQKDAICAFFNFQLHYAKILLGIVIAAKIY